MRFNGLFFLLTVLTAAVVPAGFPDLASADSRSVCQPFRTPCHPVMAELPSEVLPDWDRASPQGKTLVLFSLHPFLLPLSPGQQESIAKALASDDSEIFRQRGTLLHHDPLLSPVQALSAAIALRLFDRIIWIIPRKPGDGDLSLEILRQQLTAAGFFTGDEAEFLKLRAGEVTGRIRGVPIRMIHSDRLPELDGPVVVHIDLSFFKGLYKNEIATPLYTLVHDLALQIRKQQWPVSLVSLSYSTLEHQVSLNVRFLLHDFATLLQRPDLLDGEMPRLWQQRNAALNAGSMYRERTSRKLFMGLADTAPSNAGAWFDRSRTQFQEGLIKEAFSSLDRAVQLDRGYAVEYLDLAEKGANHGDLPKAIELLEKAERALPQNSFVPLLRADLLIRAGHADLAGPILEKISRWRWSPQFHPEVPAQLETMQQQAKSTAKGRQ